MINIIIIFLWLSLCLLILYKVHPRLGTYHLLWTLESVGFILLGDYMCWFFTRSLLSLFLSLLVVILYQIIDYVYAGSRSSQAYTTKLRSGVAVCAASCPKPHYTAPARHLQPACFRGCLVLGLPHTHHCLHRQPYSIPHHTFVPQAAGDCTTTGREWL